MSTSSYERIWSVVRRIPRGRVATYGQIARIAGLPRQARMVGYALHALPDEIAASVPWQRVINAQGRISLRAFAGSEAVQRKRLEREGVKFDARARVDLERFGWQASGGKRTRSGSR
ncbi:MAG: MGMT family protein [Myxococcota bacterium]